MPETTQRWVIRDGPAAAPAPTQPPPLPLPLTLVSDRAPMRPHFATPVVFPGYEILSELGRGGMGVVYRARQRNLNRLVALKVILGGPLASAEDKARFRIEAEAAARLHHPNIVQVYDVGEHAGFSYIALELIEGSTLRQWQNGRPVEPKAAARVVGAVARAIQHAHEQGIVHRDLKPANILLAVDSGQWAVDSSQKDEESSPSTAHCPLPTTKPKVTDFGLAKPVDGGNDLTGTGVACGTPNYMAPEQVRGKALGTGVDVYGLGAVLFELLAGRPPFVGSDAAEVMNLILKSEPPGVRKFAPAVPRDLAVIVAKCLEKEPARRYLTARDAADDLDRFLAGRPIAARPVSSAERAWRWVKRNPVVAAFLFISTVGCTLTGGLAVALARSESDQRAARASSESAREEAEAARDDLRTALTAAQSAQELAEREQKATAVAKGVADAAREEAKQEAKRAVEKQAEADKARTRAEDNLRVARGVIRGSMRELTRHPGFAEEGFRAARETLLARVREFRDTVAKHAPNTVEWLDDISDVSHYLGYLEYLNQNHVAAAAEYKTAAAAAARWAELEPRKREPRARQAFSLLNAGNALVNAGRYSEAEPIYFDSVRLIDAVLAESPADKNYLFQSIKSYGRLVNLYRAQNKPVEWEKAARGELVCARRLARACGDSAESLRVVAAAQQNVATPLALLRKWDEADCHFAAAVATRERVRDAAPGDLTFAGEYIDAVLAHAAFLTSRGHADRAGDTLRVAVGALEAAQAAAPSADAPALELASGCTRYADFLRDRRQFKDAERRYEQALGLTAAVVRRAPNSLAAREVAARAAAGRAHLYNSTDRHREAAAEWARLAVEYPDPAARTSHALFVQQSFLYAGDWRAAVAAADAQMKEEQPGWMWADLGRVWCLAVRHIEADPALAPADKLREAARAVGKAVACLERARASGEFATPERVRWFATNPDFAPARGTFDPAKK